jgi:ABC-type phosphate transport system substrate-binding protein
MKLNFRNMALSGGILLSGALYGGAPEGVVLIGNAGVQRDSINAAALQDIYIGRTTYWDDGQNIVIAVLPAQTDAAVKEISGLDSSQFKTFWQRLVFSGRGQQPRKADDATAIVSLVSSTKGAIALVPAGTPLKGVKQIEIK